MHTLRFAGTPARCYFCGKTEKDRYSWAWTDEAGKVQPLETEVRLVEIERVFEKNKRAVYLVCKSCMSLLLVPESQMSYRYGHKLPEPKQKGLD